MKKSDLKTGMWVICKNGNRGMVLLNTKDGDIVSGDTNWFPLDSYNNELKYPNSDFSEFDIVKIVQPSANTYYYNIDRDFKLQTLWERNNSIDIHITAEIENIEEIKNTIDELQDKLSNLKIKLS